MKLIYSTTSIILGLVVFVADGVPIPDHRVLYADSSDGYKAGFSEGKTENGDHDLFYAYAKANNEDGVRYGTGFLQHSAMVNDNFGVKHKIGVLGAELDANNGRLGSMARVTGIDGTLVAGPVDVNYGINADTGGRWDRGPEVKFLGIGGKITDQEVEACFIVCVGFNWSRMFG